MKVIAFAAAMLIAAGSYATATPLTVKAASTVLQDNTGGTQQEPKKEKRHHKGPHKGRKMHKGGKKGGGS